MEWFPLASWAWKSHPALSLQWHDSTQSLAIFTSLWVRLLRFCHLLKNLSLSSCALATAAAVCLTECQGLLDNYRVWWLCSQHFPLPVSSLQKPPCLLSTQSSANEQDMTSMCTGGTGEANTDTRVHLLSLWPFVPNITASPITWVGTVIGSESKKDMSVLDENKQRVIGSTEAGLL